MANEDSVQQPSALAPYKNVDDVFPVRRVLGMLQRNERLNEPPPPKECDEHHESQDVNLLTTTQREEIVSESPPSQPDEVTQVTNPSKGELLGSLPCPRCAKMFSSASSLQMHLADVNLCDQPLRPIVLPKGGTDGKLEPKACFKCAKTFASWPELRDHINLCNQPSNPIEQPNNGANGKLESKTCFKCGKTFASWQGLRGHLNRIKPCGQEKPATTGGTTATTTRRRHPATKTCEKCGKTFSSPQSLRIHMNRVKPCDQDKSGGSTPTTPQATTQPATTLLLNAEELQKEADRKAKARYQARRAYLKKRGRLGELGEPPAGYQFRDRHKTTVETVSKPDLKRSATDELPQNGENVDETNSQVKRVRVQEEASQDTLTIDSPSDVSGLTQISASTPILSVPPQKMLPSDGSFEHRSSNGHGGDLLSGGCSCPPCVRRWARKLMNRMQQLEDEVMTLRKQKSTTGENGLVNDSAASSMQTSTPALLANSTIQGKPVDVECPVRSAHSSGVPIQKTAGASIFRSLLNSRNHPLKDVISGGDTQQNSHVLPRPDGQFSGNESHPGDVLRADQDKQHNSTASVLQAAGSDKQSLLESYTHMNDQILLNERMVEDSSSHVQILEGCNPETAMDFRKQVEELRASITAEKSKREITVSALIALEWKPQRDQFMPLLESASHIASPDVEQTFHTKWSEISNRLSEKVKSYSELERRMNSLAESGSSRSRYAEMGELSSKMAAEYSAKTALEADREGVYLGLVKSNPRIRSLVKSALL